MRKNGPELGRRFALENSKLCVRISEEASLPKPTRKIFFSLKELVNSFEANSLLT